MPPLPVMTNVWRCALKWTTSYGYAVNVVHVLTALGDSEDVGLALNNSFSAAMFEPVSSDATLGSVDLLPLDGTSPTDTYVFGSPFTGGGGGESIPGYAPVISFYTANRGKSHRGRLYLPFLAESKQNDGQLGVADFPIYRGAWETWRSDLISNQLVPVVASYTLGTYDQILQMTAKPKLGFQRRRQYRRAA